MPVLPIICGILTYLSFIFQYIDCGRPADAAEAFKAAIELQQNHVKAWNNLGLLYENQGIEAISFLACPLQQVLKFYYNKEITRKQREC